VATASSEHYMSTRYQPLSNLFADGDGRASFQKWSSFRAAKRSAADQGLASSTDGMTGPVRAQRSRLAKATRDMFIR